MDLTTLLAFGSLLAFLMVIVYLVARPQSKEQVSDLDSVLLEACIKSGKSVDEALASMDRVKGRLADVLASRSIGC